MTEHRPSVLSAKVPLDLRQDFELLAQRGGHGDLSIPVRAALREYADARLRPAPSLLSGGTGARRTRATATEAAAALKVAAKVGTQRRRALEAYERVGEIGLTADEVASVTGARLNSVSRRVSDLVQGGLVAQLEPVTEDHAAGTLTYVGLPGGARRAFRAEEEVTGDVITRETTGGARATVYAITAAGARALEDARGAGR